MATHLAAWGAPGPQAFHTGFTRNPILVGRTQLRVTGVPGPLNTIAGRAPSILVPIASSDTLSVQWNEDPVNSNTIVSQDTVRISVAELSQLFNQILTGDTANVTLSETVALVQQGVFVLTSSDTISVTLSSEISALNVVLARTDTVSVSVTDGSTLTTPALIITSTDTVSVTLTETSVLGIFTGVLQFASGEPLNIALSEASDLTMITPTRPAQIRIQPLTARIQIVPI